VATSDTEKQTNYAVHFAEGVYGRPMRFYRLPGGAGINSPHVRSRLRSLNLIHASWSIDSLDWKLKDSDEAAYLVTEQLAVAKRGIVLIHDIHDFSVRATLKILNWIKENNNSGKTQLRLYTIDAAVDLQNQMSSPQKTVLK
jgi:hypothetical protein